MKNHLWNMFATIKNGLTVKKSFVLQPKKKICESILNILWDEGFILGYKISETNTKMLKIFLKYKNGNPAIHSLNSLSTPGLRVYFSAKHIWKIDATNSLLILSTNKGFMSITECKKLKVGGEPFLLVK
jgi:small subunit ribosomal protein S8